MNVDGITNELFFNNSKMLFHTWYARSYNVNQKHTNRINNILTFVAGSDPKNDGIKPIMYKDKLFYYKKLIRKYYKYLLIKLGR